jgi:hypothetical protein
MFKILITAIDPSAPPLSDGGTASLIPEYMKEGGNRVVQIEIAIDADRPYQHAETTYTGDEEDWIAEWLPDQYGMRGKPVGDNASPIDAVAALSAATWLKWEVVSGQEILDLPDPSLPPGAIA